MKQERTAHPLAGKIVKLKLKLDGPNIKSGDNFRIEDYWEKITGTSWMDCEGNPACICYAMRSGFAGLPTDNNVVYGKVGAFGHLVHTSELGEVVK